MEIREVPYWYCPPLHVTWHAECGQRETPQLTRMRKHDLSPAHTRKSRCSRLGPEMAGPAWGDGALDFRVPDIERGDEDLARAQRLSIDLDLAIILIHAALVLGRSPFFLFSNITS